MPDSLYSLASFVSFIPDHQEKIREMYKERDERIRAFYADGMTYQAIGEAVGLTKERIRQICTPNPALEALRYHVTGAIERGESEAIVEQSSKDRGTR